MVLPSNVDSLKGIFWSVAHSRIRMEESCLWSFAMRWRNVSPLSLRAVKSAPASCRTWNSFAPSPVAAAACRGVLPNTSRELMEPLYLLTKWRKVSCASEPPPAAVECILLALHSEHFPTGPTRATCSTRFAQAHSDPGG